VHNWPWQLNEMLRP